MNRLPAAFLTAVGSLLSLALFAACAPKNVNAERAVPAPAISDVEARRIGQGLFIPEKDIPQYKPRIPPLVGPKDPSNCGPAGLCVNPDLNPMAYGADLNRDRKIAMLATGCGPNAYCTAAQRREVIAASSYGIDLFLKAILAHTCNAAACDQAWFASVKRTNIMLYQKACSLGACEIQQIKIDLCVAAICNRPNTADKEEPKPSKEPEPKKECAGDDEACKKKRLEDAENEQKKREEEQKAAQKKADEAKAAADAAAQKLKDAKTLEEQKAAENELKLAEQRLKMALKGLELANARLAMSMADTFFARSSLEAGRASDGSVSDGLSKTGSRVVELIRIFGGQETTEQVFTIYKNILEVDYSIERSALEQLENQDKSGPSSPVKIPKMLLTQVGTPGAPVRSAEQETSSDLLNEYVNLVAQLPDLTQQVTECAADIDCVTAYSAIKALVDFMTYEDVLLSPLDLPIPGPDLDVGTIVTPKSPNGR
ncbi:hypothetical protein [Deinococcus soli (ex Cha et al. 2016)]|uniref:Uncharacterized protein n=2 Tax=Deinococcus soli (ex Cha et al. 2016) TaxID=1309411 RepID=A0AAE3XD92_9DEIO|nr:hypothetical protein [Deinococcus soli (ex Cha et al. 2016)]MDR6218529.1 hypothetical protein [Deinococcus soli (ex Cha et al. 2016)]MDR6329269.1 hypothetical protein [Deinococcus soli (ex Cha et al. 2016)]MDR6751542.1 hypothetical protein [Deinococcus soli (ex Cha et al. 2016)]